MGFKDFFKKFIKTADRLMFDKSLTCNLCGEELFIDGDFCKDCEETLILNDSHFCLNCGRKTNISTARCTSCKGEWEIDKARSVYEYAGGAEKLIKALKYGKKQYLAEIVAPKLKTVYIKNMFAPDLITFVPMTEKAMFERGFNQSELLSRELAKLVDNRSIALLLKTKDTVKQQNLSAKDRKKNLIGSFKVIDKDLVKGKRILLVDDVLTTGATAGACAEKLKKAGAKSVYLLTVASVELKEGC